MLLFGLILLSGLILPQDVTPSQDYTIPQSELTKRMMKSWILNQAENARKLDHIQIDKTQVNDNLCFAIRSYIFKREDGNAPELVGSTTCTPATALRQRRVGHPRGQLVPLGLTFGDLK
jgi:hypothetical protein